MKRILLAALIALPLLAPVWAEEQTWDDLKEAIYGAQTLLNGDRFIRFTMPYRTDDDARTLIGARVIAPKGKLLHKISIILDENPMPVSAVFTFAEPQPRFMFEATLRVNGPTPVHLVAQTTEGALFVAEGFVKTSGQGACAAPPGTDPQAALETLGDMEIRFEQAGNVTPSDLFDLSKATSTGNRARLSIKHPSHSGMQMDQITLLFLPSRFVQSLNIDRDGGRYVDITGSISLSENPELTFSLPRETFEMGVTMTDTDGTVTQKTARIPAY